MNTNSKIITYINEHPTTWRDDFAELLISIRESGDLAIFVYGANADFSNPIVCEARGIIIDLANMEVVCWPFRKFNNWDSPNADDINWNTACVQEKVDGSIIKRYYYNNEWYWATNGVINAENAPLYMDIQSSIKNYLELIKMAENYSDAIELFTNPELTYIFELTSPYNTCIVEYPTTMLTLIGIRNNLTGKEYTYHGDFKTPIKYSAKNFEECKKLMSTMNKKGKVTNEGFVVVDHQFNRIKIKTEEYFAMHHVINNGHLNKMDMIKLAIDNSKILTDIKVKYPILAPEIDYYIEQAHKFVADVDKAITDAKILFNSYEGDRKKFAETVKNDSLSAVMFYAITNLAKDYVKSLMANSYIDSKIPNYKEAK